MHQALNSISLLFFSGRTKRSVEKKCVTSIVVRVYRPCIDPHVLSPVL